MQPTLVIFSSSAMTSDKCPCCFTRMCSTRAVSFIVASVGGMATASMLTAGLVAFGVSSRVMLQVMVTRQGGLCPANLEQGFAGWRVVFGAGDAGITDITWAAFHRAASICKALDVDHWQLDCQCSEHYRILILLPTIPTPAIRKTV